MSTGGYSAIEYGFIHKALADLTGIDASYSLYLDIDDAIVNSLGGIPGRIDDLQNNMDANWQLLLSYFKVRQRKFMWLY